LFVCRLQTIKFDLDFDVALLALDLRFATGIGQQVRAAEVDLGCSTAILVVDRLRGPGGNTGAIDRWITGGHPGRVFVLAVQPLCR
jgi:hypothetical protein